MGPGLLSLRVGRQADRSDGLREGHLSINQFIGIRAEVLWFVGSNLSLHESIDLYGECVVVPLQVL